MGNLFRKDFSRGWFPSADSVNAPDNALLRMDNCILDERGIVSLRPGSEKVEGAPTTVYGVARHFNGVADNLSTFDSNTTYTQFTGVFWLKRDSVETTRNAFCGRMFSSGNGWAIYVDAANLLSFQHDSTVDTVACPDLTDWTVVAVTHEGLGGSGETKFYAGSTPATVALIATVASATGGFAELSVGGIHIGWSSGAQHIGVSAWNGSIDRSGTWTVLLTLAEMQFFAGGGLPRPESAKLIVDIVGDNPEPAIFNVAGGQFMYPTGSTVVPGIVLSTTVGGPTQLAGEVNALYTAMLDGVRHRMAAAGGFVYDNSNQIASGFNGTGVSFSDYLGQIFFAWSTLKKKWDGQTLRNWGIGKPLSVNAGTPSPDFNAFPKNAVQTWTAIEGTFTYQDNESLLSSVPEITPDPTTQRGTISETFATVQDYNVYSDGGVGTDLDEFIFFVRVDDPAKLDFLTVMVDVNNGDFHDDYYFYKFGSTTVVETEVPIPDQLADRYDVEGFDREDVLRRTEERPTTVSVIRNDRPLTVTGWSRLSIKRGQFERVGATPGKDWSTVKGLRFTVEGTGAIVRIDIPAMQGGSKSPLSGKYTWRAALVKDFGSYVAVGEISDISNELDVQNRAVDLLISATSSSDYDTVWIYRMGGTLNAFYRVKTYPFGGGVQSFRDDTPDIDALIQNIRAETENIGPPDNIVDIEGPYYDRLFCLTYTHLYPSRVRNPESFAPSQVIRVADAGEVAHWIRRALGGLYIGTSKDIYRLDGDGAELPDGTINFRKTPINIGNPPIASNAVTQEGNALVYLAADGWRTFTGVDSSPIAGDMDLLYRRYARHGVDPVNIYDLNARFYAAIAKGQLVAVTPEGTSLLASTVLHRYDFGKQRWYRHVYPYAFRSILREPDGGLIAGDINGWVYQLDTGNLDNGALIPVIVDTKIDDNGQPLQLKDCWDFRTRIHTGGNQCQIGFYFDGRDIGTQSANGQVLVSATFESFQSQAIDTFPAFIQAQLRFQGSFSTFKLYEFNLQYREHAVLTYFHEKKPLMPHPRRRRFGGLTVSMNTFGSPVTVIPVLDDADLSPIIFNTTDAQVRNLSIITVVGRDLWAKVSSATGFELYDIAPVIIEEYPNILKGRTPSTNLDWDGDKAINNIKLKACTLGQLRTFSVITDESSDPVQFTLQSPANEALTETFPFPATRYFKDIALNVDGDVEIWNWTPNLLYKLPAPCKVWDTGHVDMGTDDLHWIREVRVKCKSPEALVVTPYFDDVAFPAYTHAVNGSANKYTVFSVPIGREYKGKQPRIVVTTLSSQEFHPFWVEFYFRGTGTATQKKPYRVKAT